MEEEIRKAKRFNYTVLAILLIIAVFIAVWCISYHVYHTFTTEKWLKSPDKRTRLVGDLLSRYDLIGLSEGEIAALLGENDTGRDYFSPEKYVYYLGPERGIISIDSEWLIIEFDDGAVSKYFVRTD